MSSVKRLIANTSSMFIAQGLQPILSILLAIVIGRTLGNETFGKYAIIFQFFSIFQITCSFGLKTLLTREVATQKMQANKLLTNGFLLGIPASLLNIVILMIAVFFLKYNREVSIGAYIIAISLIATAMTDIFSGVLTGFEEVKKIAYTWSVFLILKTGFSILVLLLGYGLYALIIVHVVTKFIQTGLIYYYIYKTVGRLKFEIDFKLCKKLIRMGWSLALLAISVSLFWRFDTILLSKMVSEKMVGDYSAAYRLFHFMLMTVRSFSLAFLPVVSSMYAARKHDFRKASRKAIRYLTVLILPIAVITTFASPQVISIVWGDKFNIPVVTGVLQVMIWSIIPFGISEVFGAALIAANKQVTHFTIKTVALFLKIGLTYLLVLKYGVVGAAISTVVAMTILLIMQVPFIIPKMISLRLKSVLIPFFKVVLSVGLMTGTYYYLKDYFFMIGAIIATAVYFGSLFLFQIVSKEDKKFFKNMKKKKA